MNLKEFIFKRENPVIFDKKGEFVYFPTNKVMQTSHFNKTEHYDKLDKESIYIIEQIYCNDLIFYK